MIGLIILKPGWRRGLTISAIALLGGTAVSVALLLLGVGVLLRAIGVILAVATLVITETLILATLERTRELESGENSRS